MERFSCKNSACSAIWIGFQLFRPLFRQSVNRPNGVVNLQLFSYRWSNFRQKLGDLRLHRMTANDIKWQYQIKGVKKRAIKTPHPKNRKWWVYFCATEGDKSATDAAERVQSANSFALCRAARRKSLRSRINIVNLCEQSGYWRATQKGPIRTYLYKKIVNDWAIFEANEKPDAQHSRPMWAIGLLKSDSKRANQNDF